MSKSNFFENTSHSSFEGSRIINTADHRIYVAGDHITQIIDSQNQIVSSGARGESTFDQYHNFRRCDIRLLRELSTSEINEEMTLWWDRNPTRKKLKYTRTAHSVSLFGVASNYSHCVAMHYSGRDAYAAWERDLLRYSNRHPNVVHLFGLSSQKSNPALVFCDDVVPLRKIWEKCSSIVKCYLRVNFILEKLSCVVLRIWQDGNFQKLWEAIHLQMKVISQEAMGKLIPEELSPYFSFIEPEEPEKLLPFDLFHDETRTLEYLWDIRKKDSPSQQIITSSPLDILNFTSNFRSTSGKKGTVLEHGWTQFHYNVTNWGRNFFSDVDLPQTLGKKLVSAWLCQGMFVANATGSDELRLEQDGELPLFLDMVNQDLCLESGSTKVSWGEYAENYYFWSYDPVGSSQISQRVCDLIGLPKYKMEIYSLGSSYFSYQFQAIQQVQKLFGYDPLTQDFAEACGLPLIEVVPHSEDPGNSQEELDSWHIIHGDLDEVSSSDSESIHNDTSAQPQEIWFPMPRLRQEMNLTVSELLNYQDLDASEQESCSQGWSDLGSETSKFDSPPEIPIQYFEPTPWLEGYLIGNDGLSKSCRGVRPVTCTRCGIRFGNHNSGWGSTVLKVEQGSATIASSKLQEYYRIIGDNTANQREVNLPE
ncbi:hypothetical protein K435DRAFT_835440 [Dendrothele bispora CBS 962.96]|uniref:Protein kinase domain-containing protein n=1 Tax=Dendrothele bispora (strain CBS 962.96) TaxID=1314807 RepID=A0A4S8MN60_DENBC|nr:hypothetical protein K435DRAFT_835440 [Dendrothele bispora CBS 962.96]